MSEMPMPPINQDLFCKVYQPLSDIQKQNIFAIKDYAEKLLYVINAAEQNTESGHLREISLARTKLEECVMWAVKGVANN